MLHCCSAPVPALWQLVCVYYAGITAVSGHFVALLVADSTLVVCSTFVIESQSVRSARSRLDFACMGFVPPGMFHHATVVAQNRPLAPS